MTQPVRMQKVLVIRTNGTEEHHEVPYEDPFDAIAHLIGVPSADHINLRDGRTMWIAVHTPVNSKATDLLREVGAPLDPSNRQRIAGDVCVTNSEEFE